MTSLQFVRCHSYVIISATRTVTPDFQCFHPGYVVLIISGLSIHDVTLRTLPSTVHCWVLACLLAARFEKLMLIVIKFTESTTQVVVHIGDDSDGLHDPW